MVERKLRNGWSGKARMRALKLTSTWCRESHCDRSKLLMSMSRNQHLSREMRGELDLPRKSEGWQMNRLMVAAQPSITSCASPQNCRSTVRNLSPFCKEAKPDMNS